MTDLNRRSFLKQTSVSVATVGLLSSLPAFAVISESPHGSKPEAQATGFAEPMIAHVSDVATGEVALLVGTREIIFRDPQLVSRLIEAAS